MPYSSRVVSSLPSRAGATVLMVAAARPGKPAAGPSGALASRHLTAAARGRHTGTARAAPRHRCGGAWQRHWQGPRRRCTQGPRTRSVSARLPLADAAAVPGGLVSPHARSGRGPRSTDGCPPLWIQLCMTCGATGRRLWTVPFDLWTRLWGTDQVGAGRPRETCTEHSHRMSTGCGRKIGSLPSIVSDAICWLGGAGDAVGGRR